MHAHPEPLGRLLVVEILAEDDEGLVRSEAERRGELPAATDDHVRCAQYVPLRAHPRGRTDGQEPSRASVEHSDP